MKRPPSARPLGQNESGVAAVEFALILPIMLLVLFGGYVMCEAVSISRKVTITTRALADLTSQYASMVSSDMATVLGASTEIIAPFNATPLSMRISEISTDITGLNATVTWSQGVNTTCYAANSPFVIPVAMRIPNMSYIYSEVTYSYSPAIIYGIAGPFVISDHIYMLPRTSSSVTYSGC